MFFYISKTLGFLTQPGGLLICFVLLFVIFKSKKYLFGAMLVYLVFSSGAIVEWAAAAWEIKSAPINQKYKYGVVLTGGIINDLMSEKENVVIDKSADRIWQTALLYKKGKIEKIIISGASFYDTKLKFYEESLGAKDFLLACGVPDSSIILERRSVNTSQNARFTADLLKAEKYTGPVVLITSASHMRRSLACFKKQNISCIPYSTCPIALYLPVRLADFLPDAEEWAKSKILTKEWIGFMMYKLVDYI